MVASTNVVAGCLCKEATATARRVQRTDVAAIGPERLERVGGVDGARRVCCCGGRAASAVATDRQRKGLVRSEPPLDDALATGLRRVFTNFAPTIGFYVLFFWSSSAIQDGERRR